MAGPSWEEETEDRKDPGWRWPLEDSPGKERLGKPEHVARGQQEAGALASADQRAREGAGVPRGCPLGSAPPGPASTVPPEGAVRSDVPSTATAGDGRPGPLLARSALLDSGGMCLASRPRPRSTRAICTGPGLLKLGGQDTPTSFSGEGHLLGDQTRIQDPECNF